MSFRIRCLDGEDDAEFNRCEKAYRQHLCRFADMSRTHLWKFFWWDFFHDGAIESIHLQGDLKTVVIHLSCPNIKWAKPGGRYEYMSVGFKCTFHNVSTFTLQYETPEHDWDVRRDSTLFLDAEINTSPVLDGFGPEDENDPDPHHSLLMRLLADDSIIWAELVFSDVDVDADEPTAFALMESDPKFDVPTYSKERDEPTD